MPETTGELLKKIRLSGDSALVLKYLDIEVPGFFSLHRDSMADQLAAMAKYCQWVPLVRGVERVIIRVDVPKSLYVRQSPGGYFHRIGSSKRRMTPDV